MRILIVDDEFVSRKKAQKIMSQYGKCDVASNGIDALEAFHLAHNQGGPYDLITMDIMMPDMDGIETLKRIRTWEKSRNIELEDIGKSGLLEGGTEVLERFEREFHRLEVYARDR